MKPGRNDPCPCGSGKKYKKCCQEKSELDSSAPKPSRKGAAPSKAECNQLVALFNSGHYAELESRTRLLLERYPDSGFAWKTLGASLQMQGESSLHALQKAAEMLPNDAEAHYNLGNTLKELGQLDEAGASYRLALRIKPNFVEALNNLAFLLNLQGKPAMALDIVDQSLQIRETAEAKSIFIACVKKLQSWNDSVSVRSNLVRALSEPWGQIGEWLVRFCAAVAKLNPCIRACVERAIKAWPQRLSAQDLFTPADFAAVAVDPLLRALLDAAPICDTELERFLTMARQVLLDAATGETPSAVMDENGLRFYSALARQCFINEYAFAHTADEIRKATALRDSLVAAMETKAQMPALWLVAVAAYFPLQSLPLAEQLLGGPWPKAVAAILTQQVREPAEERQYRATIPCLTGIENEVSQRVRSQYEENPYPRWVRTAPSGKPMTVISCLRQLFLTPFQPPEKYAEPEILIAGCGTGQHSVVTALRFHGARVLAIDLSMASLCYAKRKTRELGLNMIEYAQADILKLGSLDRSFDVIESVGVLHHLADPWAGWRVLLSLLRPGGFMKLGFYSEVARRNVVWIRTFIAEHGYGSTAAEIRRCRQDLLELDESANLENTLKSADFFSISTCRDLLFHVQEYRMTLTGIESFLRENNLLFLGFETDADILHAYKQRFPDDHTATNLGQWEIFENENPDTFLRMYQFWVQKIA